jgi:hypothetical protein
MPGAVTVGQLIVNLSANTADLKSDLAGTTATVKQSAQEMTNAWAGVTTSTGNVNAAGKALITTLKEQIATFGMSDQQLIQYKANLAGVGGEVQALNARLTGMKDAAAAWGEEQKKAGAHAEQFSLSTAGARRELIVLAHEMSQGNYSKFGGSLLVLAEQTNAASLLFSATGLTLGALAAVIGLTGYELYKMHSEIAEFNKSLQLTGNFAGVTRDSLNSMATSIQSSATGGVRKATDVLDGLAATGHFTSGALLATGESALQFARLTGKSSEDVVKFFDGMTNGVTAWAETANKSYHFLNAAQYEHIATLDKEGNSQQAVIEAMKLMNAGLDENAKHLSYWQKNAQGWTMILDAASESMRKFAFPTIDEKVASQIGKLNELQDKMRRMTANGTADSGPADQIRADIAKQRQVVHDLVAQSNKAEIDAAAKQERDLANMKAVAAQKDLDQIKVGLKTRDELRADAEAKIRKDAALVNENAAANGKAIVETADSVARLVAASNAKYVEKGSDDRAKVLENGLNNAKAMLDGEKLIYDSRINMLARFHTNFGTSDEDFLAGRTNARAEYAASEEIAFAKESSLLQAAVAHAKNPEEVAAAKTKYDQITAVHQKFLDEMRNTAGGDSVTPLENEKKAYDVMIKAMISGGDAEIKKLDDQIAKQRLHNAEIGKTKEQIELVRQAAINSDTEQMAADADFLRAGLQQWDLDEKSRAAYAIRLNQLDDEIVRRKILAGLNGEAAAAEAAVHDLEVSRKLADQTIKDWKNVGTSISEALTSAFGSAGKAAGGMFKSYADNAAHQLQINKELAIAATKKDGDPTKLKEIDDLHRQSAQSQIQGYAGMTAAAQGFFAEGSRGYQAMHAATVALQSAEIALSLIKGVNAVLTQGEGDPYSAFVRMAAMAAIVTGLGVAISGGGGSGGQSAADVQKAQGTGSVFGDSSAKSDSVRRSIEQLQANSDLLVPINQGMLTSLQAIEASMVGLTNLVVRTPGITDGTNMGIQTGLISGGDVVTNAVASIGEKVFGTSNIFGTLSRTLSNLFSNTKQTIVDSGLQYGGGLRGLQAGNGFQQYASVDTTKSSFFGLSKSTSNSVQTQGLNDELSKQFGLIFTNLDKSLQAASVALGGTAADVSKVLDGLTLESTKVSLKGLTGTALTDALNSVISKSMDEIAAAAFPQFDQFRKVGEGYAETVMRIAGDYAKLDSILAATGTTFGPVGMASIAAREHLIELAGGIDQLNSQTNSFAQNFLSKAEQLAPVQKYVTDQLAAMGLQGIDTRDKFKDVVLGLANSGALATEAGAQQYTALLALADAFAKTHAATVDLTKSEQEIADERKDLQSQLDSLTMSQTQLADKARAAIDGHNLALYDQVQAAQAAKDAVDAATKDATSILSLQAQLYDATGDKAAAAAVQEQQRLAALKEMTPAVAAATQATWDAVDAAKARADTLSQNNALLTIQGQIYELTGNKAGAAAVLEQQHAAALALLSPALQDATKELWATQESAEALKQSESVLQSFGNALVDSMTKATAAAKALNDFNKSLTLGNLSPLSKDAQYTVAKDQFEHADASTIKDAATAFLEASKARGAGSLAYARDFAAVQAGVASAAAGQASYAAGIPAAWRAAQAFMVDGSHAVGLDSVPFDGYIAKLHKDEGVLTASQNKARRESGGNSAAMTEATAQQLLVALNKMASSSAKTEQHARTTATILQRVTKDGDSLVTVPA